MHLLRILVIDDDEDDYVVTRDTLSDIWGNGVVVDWRRLIVRGSHA